MKQSSERGLESIPGVSICIHGGKELSGTVAIQGSKNALHKILGACVRWPGVFRLRSVPDIQDAKWMLELFVFVGGVVTKEGDITILDSRNIIPRPIGEEYSEKSSGTFLFAGALLARFGKVQIAPPGGDKIGYRPVDYHLAAFRAMGAEIEKKGVMYEITCKRLTGVRWKFPGMTVNGTVNALLVASGAKEKSVLSGCAIETDIENAIDFMNALGAHIEILSHEEGIIEVVPQQEFVSEMEFEIIPDRNATATYAIAGALLCRELTLTNINPDLDPLWEFLRKVGTTLEINEKKKVAKIKRMSAQRISETVEGKIPPGFSTDWGSMTQVLLTQLAGTTEYHDNVFQNRFALVPELAKMGAKAVLHNTACDSWVDTTTFSQSEKYDRVRFEGPTDLRGAEVRANDIRNGAGLVLAGLVAQGQTIIREAVHIKRGYEDMVLVFKKLGADIEWVE